MVTAIALGGAAPQPQQGSTYIIAANGTAIAVDAAKIMPARFDLAHRAPRFAPSVNRETSGRSGIKKAPAARPEHRGEG
jgi:hypothetical protein